MGVLSSLSGAISIPGTSLVADGLLIAIETCLYRKQLGLSNDDMQSLIFMMNMPIDILADKYLLKSLALACTAKRGHGIERFDLF
jgi:hypothetical protein